jgi:hypothetical protein
MAMMQMYFYVSNRATILFKEWATESDWQMLGSAVRKSHVLLHFLQLRLKNAVLNTIVPLVSWR